MQGTNKVSLASPWRMAGNITVQNSALAVIGRDWDTVNAIAATNKVQIELRNPIPHALLFRFRSDGSNNDDSVLELYAAKGKDHFHRIAQLTVVQGQQDTDISTIHFVDTITPASEDALFSGTENNLTDMIAHYYINTLGYDKFVFIASDLDTTTLYVDVSHLYE
jgi:hypothetical protein